MNENIIEKANIPLLQKLSAVSIIAYLVLQLIDFENGLNYVKVVFPLIWYSLIKIKHNKAIDGTTNLILIVLSTTSIFNMLAIHNFALLFTNLVLMALMYNKPFYRLLQILGKTK